MAVTVPFVIGAYLFGALSPAYLLARLVKGVDLRSFGTGALTSSNAAELLGKWAAVVVGVTDILKGSIPIWAARSLDMSLTEQMAVGLATIVGHNWSILFKFYGGRGLTTVIGVLLAAAPMELLLFTIVAVFGVTFSWSVALFMGLSTALLPLWSFMLQEEAPILWGTGLMVALVVLKRLTGNRLDGLPAQGKAQVLLNRLLHDRDTKERGAWVRRSHPIP